MDNFSFIPCEICQEPIIFEDYQNHISNCRNSGNNRFFSMFFPRNDIEINNINNPINLNNDTNPINLNNDTNPINLNNDIQYSSSDINPFLNIIRNSNINFQTFLNENMLNTPQRNNISPQNSYPDTEIIPEEELQFDNNSNIENTTQPLPPNNDNNHNINNLNNIYTNFSNMINQYNYSPNLINTPPQNISYFDNIINNLIRTIPIPENSYNNLINISERIGIVRIGVKNINYVAPILIDNNQYFCSISQEELSERDSKRKTLCGHIFSSELLEEWLHDNKKCPVCQIDLEELLDTRIQKIIQKTVDDIINKI